MFLLKTYGFTIAQCLNREAEAVAAAAEAERRRAAEEERQRQEQERAAREAEKRALRKLEKKYAVRLLGSLEVARPPKAICSALSFIS